MNLSEPERIPKSACRRCGKGLDGATGVGGARDPSEGAVSICAYCGTVAIFDEHHHLRPPTRAEIDEMLTDPALVKVIDGLMNMMATSLPDGVAMVCGCRINWRAELFTIVACAPDCVLAHRVIKMAADADKPYSVIE